MNRLQMVGVLLAGSTTLSGQAMAEGDAATGEKLFNGFLRCSACHAVETGVSKVAPTLVGLFGSKAGTAAEYDRYSDAMVNSGVVWDEDTLDKFLKDPQKFIPGNSMMMEGYYVVGQVTSDQHRADLIAYLKAATAQ